ncbi:MAG: zf-HC2 domain-containing protein [Myxococcales bacterium]|jgi:hypothetical protein
MDERLDIPGTRATACSVRQLERLFAGELSGQDEEQLRRHVAGCARCGQQLAALEREASNMRRELPFERFEAAVLAKGSRAKPRRRVERALLALAAGLLAVALGGQLLSSSEGPSGRNALKGGAALELFVGGAGADPRPAKDGESLAPGERIRVGYQASGKRFLIVLSVDEAGAVTPLYPESGTSLPAEPGPGTHLLPDSLELTGSGLERIIGLFSDSPLSVAAATEAAARELERAGSVERMGSLPLEAEQSGRAVRKP